ncbi:MAG: hypothetical protein HYY93_04665 [Planctomycetes bacterium]|nr:hypothetical protein [Planctomycetota bacterium]
MLRRTLLAIFVCAVVAPLVAGDRDGKKDEKKKDGPRWAASVDEAVQEAKDRNAPIMIYFGGVG